MSIDRGIGALDVEENSGESVKHSNGAFSPSRDGGGAETRGV